VPQAKPMQLNLHANATTTPKVRGAIQQSPLSDRKLAAELGVSVSTVRRWRQRTTVADLPHTPHRLRTTLSPAQERLVVELRQLLELPLDDLLVVTREFIHPEVSRSGLARCLSRHGLEDLRTLKAQRTAVQAIPAKSFKAYAPGYVHVDVKYLPKLNDAPRQYLFVAIDRASRWVYVAVKPNKCAHTAKAFFRAVIQAAPFKIQKLLTDNGKEFTDRFTSQGEREPTGCHPVDQLCAKAQIDHRLIPPRRPQTNGMVERFNGRISEILATHHFDSCCDLTQTLQRYVYLYNYHIPQKNLNHKTPIATLKSWKETHPHLFTKRIINHPGPDS
jgi:transposase InsO family protein